MGKQICLGGSIYCTVTAPRCKSLIINGAGEGNRTLVSGLGSPHSTIEPHPLLSPPEYPSPRSFGKRVLSVCRFQFSAPGFAPNSFLPFTSAQRGDDGGDMCLGQLN